MKKVFFLIILICFSYEVFAQYFTTGSDPGNIKWKQINEENFQVIYPVDFEEQAKRFAVMLEQVYQLGYQTLGTAPKKISVILHSRTVNSNGMVAIAPNRMEIYPTPHQDMYAQDWLEQLAIHEYRHVVQTSKIQQELPFILKLLFGESATAITIGAYLPFWFLEGDAVVAETALSEAGRGRNPSFLMENKAQLLEQGLVNYDKISLGSYKDYIPNRYAFGWWFSGGIRANYGAHIWDDVLTRVAKRPYSISPVNKVLKEKTGYKKEELYTQLWQGYQKEWQAEVDSLQLTPYQELNNQNLNTYTNYLYTDTLVDGSVVAVRKSRGDLTRIIRFSDGKEEIIYTPGSIVAGSFSAQGNLLIWNESRPHIRWTHADHTKTIIYNTSTEEKRVLSSESNLASPTISPSEKSFMAVASNQQGKYAIQVFNITDGKLIKSINTPQNDYIISPTWGKTDNEIYFIGLGKDGKYIASLNPENNQISTIIAPVRYDIRNLYYYRNSLFFTSAQSGIDNIVAFNLSSKELSQLTEAKFGADYGVPVKNKLIYSNYTSDGYKTVETSDTCLKNLVITTEQRTTSNHLADQLADQELGKIDFTAIDTCKIQNSSSRYRKLPHTINIHSWAPVAIDIANYKVEMPGVSFQSQNKLGTALTDFGYVYNQNEKQGRSYLNYQYIGWVPTLKLGINYGGRKVTSGYNSYSDTQWNELNLYAAIGLPLKFSTGKYNQSIQPSVSYSLSKSFNTNTPIVSNYNALNYQLYLSNILRKSELDLQSKWGQILQFNYINSFKNLTDLGQQFSLASTFYFPGLYRYDGFKLSMGYQWRDEQGVNSFNDYIRTARGYGSVYNKELYTASINYAFPICYPDWSMGKVFYFQRIRANAFIDYSAYNSTVPISSFPVKTFDVADSFKSYGIELYSDGYFFRLPAPVTFGIRGMYLADIHSFRTEFILSVNVFGI